MSLSTNSDNIYKLNAVLKKGEDIINNTVSWSSDYPSVAAVSDKGVVIAISPGTATITASYYGRTASCTVTVVGQ